MVSFGPWYLNDEKYQECKKSKEKCPKHRAQPEPKRPGYPGPQKALVKSKVCVICSVAQAGRL